MEGIDAGFCNMIGCINEDISTVNASKELL